MRSWAPGFDENGTRTFEALGLGVPPLPLWAHEEPAEMPAPHFFPSVEPLSAVLASRGAPELRVRACAESLVQRAATR